MLRRSVTQLLKQGAVGARMRAPIGASGLLMQGPLAASTNRAFSLSSPMHGKKKGKASKDSAPAEKETAASGESAAQVVNVADLTAKFEASVEAFKEKAVVVRQGKLTPAVIEAIPVTTHNHTEEPLRNIARVAMKGPRTMTVTVFEPSNVKHIVAAVLAANLNLNPQPDPKSPEQILRIPLPPTTSETKKEILKTLKTEFQHFKSSASKKSLSAVREAALKQVKKAEKTLSKDEQFAVKATVEKLFKKSTDSLQDALKQAETAVNKD